MHKTIVIPTYWCDKDYEWKNGDTIFDHPTELGTEGQLGRCIESLINNIHENDYDIMIITAAVNSNIEMKVEAEIEKIIKPFRKKINICQFGYSVLEFLKKRLVFLNKNPEIISLEGYGNIRNCQLLGPNILGSDFIIAIDDDEVVNDPALLEKSVAALGTIIEGKKVDGLSGFYVDSNGEDQLHESENARNETNIFKKKDLMQNEAGAYLKTLSGNIVPTVVAYGGLMSYSRELFTQVPHDPKITRGEDIDYLINSSFYGYQWFFNKDLSIIHLPPGKNERGAHSSPSYSKLYQDVKRFLYTRAKIEKAAIDPDLNTVSIEDLGIYPGTFLTPVLEKDSVEALIIKRDEMEDSRLFPKPEEIFSEALEYAERNKSSYFPFAELWRESCRVLAKDEVSIEYFKSKMIAK